MRYKVTTPLVIIKSAETKADWYGYDGATVPVGLNDERCDQLVKEGMLEKVKADKADDNSTTASDPTTAKDILAAVGDDKAKAQEYLDAENTKGDKARAGLVKDLTAIVEA